MSSQQLTTEMLGYPHDARLLIINCDDFGMCYSGNLGTIRSMQDGLASSCSLMMPPAWNMHAAQFLRENPEVHFAVHLTALSEYTYYRWRPLTPAEKVPTLVNEDGYFLADDEFDEIVRRADCRELEVEFRAQIEAVLGCGLDPTHLDSHYHLHASRSDIFDLTVGLAREYGLALRATRAVGVGIINSATYSHLERARNMEYPVLDHPVLDSGSLVPADIRSELERRLRELPTGLSEWALHPGVATDELRAVMSAPKVPGRTGTPEQRQADLDFATSDEAASIVETEGIQIISYKALQPFWK